MESQRDSDDYERPLSCGKCEKHVQFVCEPCDSSFCNTCVGEHISNRNSGSHDVTYHKTYREKLRKMNKNKRKESVPVIKCVVDGWQMSGKTSMIQAYIDGKCPKFESIHPTVHEIHTIDIQHQGREVCIHLYDIPTCEFYDGLRRVILQELTYDVILLCIPIDFVNLERESKILLKDLHNCIPVPPPVIVIATKIDLREKADVGVQRIPHGKKKQSVVSGRPVVFLQHGLLASATNWVTNLANESFGFVLADAGFDVWLGNSRGNTYSRNHVKLSPKEDAFWAWSWDEMAKYDIPAVIDYVLQKTGERQLYFIGHSQGTLQAFAAFSQNATLAKKVKQFFAMGPVATIAHIESPIKYMAIFTDELLYGLLGRRDFLPSDWIFKVLGSTICKEKITSIICTNVIFLLAGYDTSNLNVTRLPVYVSHAPAGTSMQDMVHFAQMSRSGRFQAYDWGTPEKNKIHYHQATPPLYNVSTMATPTVLYWADHDWLADPKDVAALQQKITNLKGSYELKSWNHLDFIWGVDAATLVYKPIINLIKKDLKS
ncbi:gastric triacylglycerol lipase-like isoform X2 [Saccostrea echinata]|uniref:gastric triacylglycerol lipase-like isoform X2 n=1 Tax=Saccostrea echinata TaxID=191078 RepID=UPI002A80F50D|nr:gastric triacylglycerol lipase-like isoform X2 [Saccostrea echinata]